MNTRQVAIVPCVDISSNAGYVARVAAAVQAQVAYELVKAWGGFDVPSATVMVYPTVASTSRDCHTQL